MELNMRTPCVIVPVLFDTLSWMSYRQRNKMKDWLSEQDRVVGTALDDDRMQVNILIGDAPEESGEDEVNTDNAVELAKWFVETMVDDYLELVKGISIVRVWADMRSPTPWNLLVETSDIWIELDSSTDTAIVVEVVLGENANKSLDWVIDQLEGLDGVLNWRVMKWANDPEGV